MTLATPARVTTALPHSPTARPSALLLFCASVVAGCGLGLAALALLAPTPQAAPLPPIAAVTQPAGTATDMAPARQSWAALFGTPPTAAPVAEAPPAPRVPEPAYDPADDFDDSAYVLRGLAMSDGTSESFALLETPEGVMMLHVGDLLPDGYAVDDITEEGVVIDLYGEPYLIGFAEDSTPVNADAYDGSMGADYEGPTRRRPIDADRYRDGPVPASPRDRFGISR
ncbi:hypothetical protein [Pararhodobacter zhoushanensis]|uniref:hypothetical protein n=1 Tax=Pararhodobacter zhoushanensis TaxID=2479545 RepID=UPI000F8D995F|nr:hypothetical protein [Pararhodobacter zhoushanensis]